MSIQSICNKEVVTIEKKATLLDVSRLLQSKHVGSVVVTENFNGKRVPVGIITDRDLASVLPSSPSPQKLPVSQIMQSQPITIKKTEGIFEATVKMQENGIKRVPVVNEDGSLFGIVSADDLLSYLAKEIVNLTAITSTQIHNEMGVRLPAEKNIRA